MNKPREWAVRECDLLPVDFETIYHPRILVIEKTALVAAAPEMLSALKATLESLLPYDKEGNMSAIVIAVCDAIAKAEGK